MGVSVTCFGTLKRRSGWLKKKYVTARVKEKNGKKRNHLETFSWTERETCINNLKLNLKNITLSSKKELKKSGLRIPGGSFKDKFSRKSLGNISERIEEEQSTLRRTRSLAISRENLFYSLDYGETYRNGKRRAQLIPRAKLIEKSFIKETSRYYEFYQTTRKFPKEIPPDYSPLPKKQLPFEEHIYDNPPRSPETNAHSSLTDYKPSYTSRTSKTSSSNGKSLENLTGLSLPNYYPDSELTDNISLTDNQSSTFSKVSLDNLTTWEIQEQPDSIPYDENIVLAKKTEGIYAKPRTIRLPCKNFDYEKLPQFKEDKCSKAAEFESNEQQQSSLEFETNKNFEEIKLNNENIRKDKEEEVLKEHTETGESSNFKRVVTVLGDSLLENEVKNHGHKYLKEFLETQKGSKKPLQSFLAKKFSNLTRKKSNLVSNQFHSLPDINISKNLQKCEKIDRKLRRCDKKFPENRFIVNIGSHLDITGDTNIPIDFHLKIAKIPQKQQFEEAVKSVNNILQSTGVDLNNNVEEKEEVMDPEIQEKLDNMKSYWTKIAGESEEIKEQNSTCKIVEIHTKVNNVKKKFEPNTEEDNEEKKPNKIQLAKQVFEPKQEKPQEKLSPQIKETCNYFENNGYESLSPNSVELVHTNKSSDSKAAPRKINVPQFDHVRYKVIKPDSFNKKILANCENQDQIDGLMQYLRNFQELLIDNNIVIIEPIRSKIPHHSSRFASTKNGISKPQLEHTVSNDDVKQGLKKHFFYRPIRVNKEVNDEELPDPEVVRQARQFFEKATNAKITTNGSVQEDPDKDKCSTISTLSDSECEEEKDDIYDSLDNNNCCATEYVSEDILEKIREYGTTVTYYGGRVVDQHYGQPVLTKVIMEEIKNNEKRCSECNKRRSVDKTLSEVNDEYKDIKFKLVKSNSCNSRLELVGAARKKNKINDKNIINENIKMHNNQPKIIGEEQKMGDGKYVRWSEMKNQIQMKNFDYQEKIVTNNKRQNDMEFEPYEVKT